MSDCNFTLNPKTQRWRCSRCGWQHPLERKKKPRKNCKAKKSGGQKILNFAAAAALHALRGSPKRTGPEIAALYEICKACPRFADDVCVLCGCRLKRKLTYRNKLAWADQHCPECRW